MNIKYENQTSLAERLSVSRRTVSTWARTGKIPSVRIGNRTVRFNPSEVDAALAGKPQSNDGVTK